MEQSKSACVYVCCYCGSKRVQMYDVESVGFDGHGPHNPESNTKVEPVNDSWGAEVCPERM
ncbi:hypothetical protein CMI37_28725 [Candidatus Pacearchaeota archaeon]|nr:hypothetical protein [Candidatus Pacearchaeota archaeon]